MIQRVWEQACKSKATRIVIATDDSRIVDECTQFGAEVILTCSKLMSGTDRVATVVSSMGLNDDEIVVNVQGDEPCVPPPLIDQVAHSMATHKSIKIVTLSERIKDAETLNSHSVVKVVTDKNGLALTFTRSVLPFVRDQSSQLSSDLHVGIDYRRHVGVYAYKADFLKKFLELDSCWLEKAEALEQLRAVWHGYRILVVDAVEDMPAGVDTQSDIDRLNILLND